MCPGRAGKKRVWYASSLPVGQEGSGTIQSIWVNMRQATIHFINRCNHTTLAGTGRKSSVLITRPRELFMRREELNAGFSVWLEQLFVTGGASNIAATAEP